MYFLRCKNKKSDLEPMIESHNWKEVNKIDGVEGVIGEYLKHKNQALIPSFPKDKVPVRLESECSLRWWWELAGLYIHEIFDFLAL